MGSGYTDTLWEIFKQVRTLHFQHFKEWWHVAHLYCLYQQIKNSNHFQNALSQRSFYRKAFLLKCHLYLEGTDEMHLFYYLKNICMVVFVILGKPCKYKTLLSCKSKMWSSSLSLTNLSTTFPEDTQWNSGWFKIFSQTLSISIESTGDSTIWDTLVPSSSS